MKYITLIIGLLVVGCETLTPEQKQKALRDSAVGTYEAKEGGETEGFVLLENGGTEKYPREQREPSKWKIVDGEIYFFKNEGGKVEIARINKDGSLTALGMISKRGGE